ncbi:MAG TPA: TolC family protein [Cyclobacteriaceae bacterium]|nr:TolC family protein [Cyclobacteriaceae bacterium]
MKRKVFTGTIVLWLLSCSMVMAQSDTVLTFQEAKARMLRYNTGLLANYYDVNIAKARVIVAKQWNNPNMIFNGDMWNSETNEYLRTRNQHLFQFEQIFGIAGKHINSVKLARIGVEMAQKQMEDVVRALLFELGNTYSEMAALQAKSILYKQVLVNYDRLMEATRKQLQVGAISQVEGVRLEAEYLDVKAEALRNVNDLETSMANLRILLQYPEDTTFYVEQKPPVIVEEFALATLTDQALSARPDLEASKINIRYNERNVKLQVSTGVPDIKVGYQPQDRGSNYIRPYHGYTTEIFLPLYNRNQGNIKIARHQLKQSELQFLQLDNKVRNEVMAAYNRYKSSNTGLANYNSEFLERLNQLNQSTNENFQKRNISLLQFIDQQRIYIQTNIELIELKQLYLNNVNELNFYVGTNIIEY